MTTRVTTHRTFVVGDEGDGADDENGGSDCRSPPSSSSPPLLARDDGCAIASTCVISCVGLRRAR